jgi:hypothetical protein
MNASIHTRRVTSKQYQSHLLCTIFTLKNNFDLHNQDMTFRELEILLSLSVVGHQLPCINIHLFYLKCYLQVVF